MDDVNVETQDRPAERRRGKPTGRLTRSQRRDQLLDTAARLISEQGFDSVTMERVAAEAGVSKALPYQHFSNSDDLVAALRDRELAMLTRRIVEAALATTGLENRVAAVVHAFFETLDTRGQTMATFLRWMPQFDMRVHDRPAAPTPFDWFVAELFEEELGLSRTAARLAQRIFAMGLVGAVDACKDGVAPRVDAERAAVVMVLAGVRSLASETAP